MAGAVSACLIAGPGGAVEGGLRVGWKLAEFSKQRLTGSLRTQIECLAEHVGPSSFVFARPFEEVLESCHCKYWCIEHRVYG